MQITTIGLDLAKSVFQIHGIDTSGKVAIAKQLRRGQMLGFFQKLPPCLVGMEACSTAHHWARELIKLGHTATVFTQFDSTLSLRVIQELPVRVIRGGSDGSFQGCAG